MVVLECEVPIEKGRNEVKILASDEDGNVTTKKALVTLNIKSND